MLNVLLVILVPVFLVVFAARMARAYPTATGAVPPLVPIVVFAYLLRLVAYYISHNVQLFTHGVGGDYLAYQLWADYIGAIWQREGVHMVTVDELAVVGRTALPPNFFALVAYLNGDDAWEGCAALSALFAIVTGLNLFSLASDLGAPPKRALLVTVVFLFLPGFVLYSAEMYKDPMVWALVFGVLASSIRLMTNLRPRDAIIGFLCAWCLWYVRFYLVFLTVAPLVVGLLGLNTKNPVRTLLLLLGGMALMIPVLAYTKVFGELGDQATTTFDNATASTLRVNVAQASGSGVVFDDGGTIYGALHKKLAYTLFAPFPWQGGSIGLQIGKLDALVWVFFFWRAIVAARSLLRTRPGLLFALLTFLLPTTVVYSFSMYNIGLILRQRMPVVLVGMLLASLSWTDE
ncbi:MAG: hypothetical protein EOP08_10325, partial [Proteobacteria bacterium]